MARSDRTESKRRAKAPGSVRRSRLNATIALAAARSLTAFAEDAERAMAKIVAGRGAEKRVHELRGALRKMEILIGALGCGFGAEQAARLERVVRRMRKGAGDVRDADVAIAAVNELCTARAEPAREEVVGVLGIRRKRALHALERLSRKESGVVRVRLEEMLENPAGRRASLPARCAAAVALAREAEAMRDAVDAGLRTPERLHQLRLNLKEARTILELVGDVLGGDAAGLAARARVLSDQLGEVNDLAILGELLGTLETKASGSRRRSLRGVASLVRAAHRARHESGARRAARDVPRLVRDIRGLIFGER
jgi:CHAD domain-containing protein